MDTFIALSTFIIGICLVISSLWTTAKHIFLVFLFKIIPFFFGLICMFNGAKLMGWI